MLQTFRETLDEGNSWGRGRAEPATAANNETSFIHTSGDCDTTREMAHCSQTPCKQRN
jgi:hypothetical protein